MEVKKEQKISVLGFVLLGIVILAILLSAQTESGFWSVTMYVAAGAAVIELICAVAAIKQADGELLPGLFPKYIGTMLAIAIPLLFLFLGILVFLFIFKLLLHR